ncbi:FAD-dependent monooxygenase [Cordyceps militaris]|uniref:FAD-dependent monooxygenase n=1 Tax=Cordyceps militaris TaxID=73501 RepID=A0A2H4SLU6_CORMI|nr:FAD-dependent monooxygenase [Cordyceps militaris]
MTLRVLIIGAGTGGLALAHALVNSHADVSVTVFERDRTRRDGLQGYRVGISPEGARSLAACVTPALFTLFQRTAAAAPDCFNMVTEQLRELLSIDGFARASTDGVAAEYSVSRMTLRQLLLTGLEDRVRFDCRFTRYVRSSDDEDGTVTAHFADGSVAVGDVLVGAEGTNSPTRRQYLPHAVLKSSGLCGLGTKAPLTEETRALLTPRMLRGVTMVQAPRGDSTVLHVMEFPWDAEHAPAPTPGSVGGTDAALLAAWPGAQFDNTRDYILLGFGAHRDQLPADVLALDGDALHALLLRRTAAWHPHLRRLFALADPRTCFALDIRTTERLPPWPSSNVALLGDAIHTMTPGLGVGANTALLDARILGEQLARAARGEVDVVEAVAAYEKEMHGYAWDRVEQSLERFNKDDAIYKPGITGWLAMMAMRTGLRLVNAVPPLKKKVAAQMDRQRGQMEERS